MKTNSVKDSHHEYHGINIKRVYVCQWKEREGERNKISRNKNNNQNHKQ